MTTARADIIARLQKEILPLQGYRPGIEKGKLGIGAIENAFPGQTFPIGAIHEFICNDNESLSATCGFVSSIVEKLMKDRGVLIWICCQQQIFPPALLSFQIDPGRIIFLHLRDSKEILWATEEALQCEGLTAVIADIPELNFTVSRRFQLTVEKSRVTGFIIRNNSKKIGTTACIARWQISSLPSITKDDLPGVGHPSWKVDLLKVRNGKTGSWSVTLAGTKFRYLELDLPIVFTETRKTG